MLQLLTSVLQGNFSVVQQGYESLEIIQWAYAVYLGKLILPLSPHTYTVSSTNIGSKGIHIFHVRD